MSEPLSDGTVYTETIVHTAPERYVNEAPYQLGIVETAIHGRVTARIVSDAAGTRARIGDRVSFVQWRDDVPYFTLAEPR